MEYSQHNLYGHSYPAVKAAGRNRLQYLMENNIHSDEHRFDRLEYKAEQVNEKAA